MNYFKLYTTLLLAAVLTSCAKVHGPEEGNCTEGETVSISVSVDSRKFGGSATNSGLPDTRLDAAASSLYSGGTLGLFIDYGKNAKYTQSNVLWENDGTNTWAPQIGMLWGKSYDKVGVYAYAPYLDGETDSTKIGFSIPADQLNGTAGADFLWFAHKKFDPNADLSGSKAIDITFNHALVKLTVSITKGNQFDGTGVVVRKVCLNGTTGDVECNITNGKVSAASGSVMTDITMRSAGTKNGKDNFDAIFWPGDGQKIGATMVTVTMSDGKEYNLTLGQELTLLGGHAYTMTVRVGKDKLEAGAVTVAGWNETPVDINNGSEYEVD